MEQKEFQENHLLGIFTIFLLPNKNIVRDEWCSQDTKAQK